MSGKTGQLAQAAWRCSTPAFLTLALAATALGVNRSYDRMQNALNQFSVEASEFSKELRELTRDVREFTRDILSFIGTCGGT